jgi:hypothetical protein
MTHPPGLPILMAKDAVAGIDGYRCILACVNADNGVVRCAVERAAS